jgi:hypothetical protein
MDRRILIVTSSSASVVVVILILFFLLRPLKDYALDVDALKDNQNLFSTSRVILTNLGKMPLTNIVIDYGGKAVEKLAFLSPGEKVFLSPPATSPLKSVRVSADHGIIVIKDFRTPIKMPGMMGS